MTAIGPFTITCYDGLFEIVGTIDDEEVVQSCLMTREAADWLAERTPMALGEIVMALETCFNTWLRELPSSNKTAPRHPLRVLRSIDPTESLFHLFLTSSPRKIARRSPKPVRGPGPKYLPKNQAMQKKQRR